MSSTMGGGASDPRKHPERGVDRRLVHTHLDSKGARRRAAAAGRSVIKRVVRSEWSVERVPPAEPGEPRVVAIRRDIRAVVFERYRGQVGILNQIPATVRLGAEIPKERPVGGLGTNGP